MTWLSGLVALKQKIETWEHSSRTDLISKTQKLMALEFWLNKS